MKQYQASHLLSVIRLTFVLVLAGCAAQPPVERQMQVSRTELLSGAALGLDHGMPSVDVDTLAVNDDMRAFLAEHVPQNANDKQKVEHILRAILDNGLRLNYNNFKTLTAEEAFYQREGNCLSFTNLFVALAREVGVDANFQEVDVPPSWSLRGGTYLNNMHLNVVVALTGRKQVVDFDMSSYNVEYHRRVITDRAALAQFHNNMGVYWLGDNEPASAFLHLRKALELGGEKGYMWANLGTLFRREGLHEEAESAFLIAIDIDQNATALSNIARLYDELGEGELAAFYSSQVEIFRRKNPYYLYDLAEKSYAGSDYTEAEHLMLVAIRLRGDEHMFHRLLALSYAQMGQPQKARVSLQRAAGLVTEAGQREHYNHKLELLAGN